jgi:hypothetical protein
MKDLDIMESQLQTIYALALLEQGGINTQKEEAVSIIVLYQLMAFSPIPWHDTD